MKLRKTISMALASLILLGTISIGSKRIHSSSHSKPQIFNKSFYYKYEEDGIVTTDILTGERRTISTFDGNDYYLYESDHEKGIASLSVNGIITETYNLNQMKSEIINWEMCAEDQDKVHTLMRDFNYKDDLAQGKKQNLDAINGKYIIEIVDGQLFLEPKESTVMNEASQLGLNTHQTQSTKVTPYPAITRSYPQFTKKQMAYSHVFSTQLNEGLDLRVKDTMNGYSVVGSTFKVFQALTLVVTIADLYNLALSVVTGSLAGMISGVGTIAKLTTSVHYYFKEDIKFEALRQGFVFDRRTFNRDVSMKTEYGSGRLSMTWDLVNGRYQNPIWKVTAQAYPFTVSLDTMMSEAKRIYEYQIRTFGRCMGDS